jgi:hypothetical protein
MFADTILKGPCELLLFHNTVISLTYLNYLIKIDVIMLSVASIWI